MRCCRFTPCRQLPLLLLAIRHTMLPPPLIADFRRFLSITDDTDAFRHAV